MKNQQKLVRVWGALTVLIALATLLVSCFLLLSIKIINNLNLFQPAFTAPIRPEDPGDTPSNPSDPPAGDTYTFSDETFTKEIYDSNTEFIIQDETGLMTFLKSTYDGRTYGYTADAGVGSTPTFIQQKYAFKYEDRTIILTDDIKITTSYSAKDTIATDVFLFIYAMEEFWFEGTFDGQGHTITYACDDYIETTQWFGFMRRIGDNGVVKNTKFKDFKIWHLDPEHIIMHSATGLFGENNGTIENCIIENISFLRTQPIYGLSPSPAFAPFVGTNNGTVKNCMVIGTYYVHRKITEQVQRPTLKAYRFTAAGGKGAENCIYDANEIGCHEYKLLDKYFGFDEFYYSKTAENIIFSDRENEKEKDSEGRNYYVGCEDASMYMGTANLSNSPGETGTTWYKYPADPTGCGYEATRRCIKDEQTLGDETVSYKVLLRSFVEFETVTIKIHTADTQYGEFKSQNNAVLNNSIEYTLPVPYATAETSANKITVVNNSGRFETISAVGKVGNDGKLLGSFSHWVEQEGEKGKVYTAYFSCTFVEVWLYVDYNALGDKNMSITGYNSSNVDQESGFVIYKIASGSNITIYAEKNSDNQTFKKTTFTFTDFDTRKEISIIYEPRKESNDEDSISKYYIPMYNVSGSVNHAGAFKVGEADVFIIVEPTELKSYGITLG